MIVNGHNLKLRPDGDYDCINCGGTLRAGVVRTIQKNPGSWGTCTNAVLVCCGYCLQNTAVLTKSPGGKWWCAACELALAPYGQNAQTVPTCVTCLKYPAVSGNIHCASCLVGAAPTPPAGQKLSAPGGTTTPTVGAVNGHYFRRIPSTTGLRCDFCAQTYSERAIQQGVSACPSSKLSNGVWTAPKCDVCGTGSASGGWTFCLPCLLAHNQSQPQPGAAPTPPVGQQLPTQLTPGQQAFQHLFPSAAPWLTPAPIVLAQDPDDEVDSHDWDYDPYTKIRFCPKCDYRVDGERWVRGEYEFGCNPSPKPAGKPRCTACAREMSESLDAYWGKDPVEAAKCADCRHGRKHDYSPMRY